MSVSGGSDLRESVRRHFASIAVAADLRRAEGMPLPLPAARADLLGYSGEEIDALPQGAYMGLGCGNPLAVARPRPGETLIDLGSGGGIDCFLASARVGATGNVVGIDMAIEMAYKARANARSGDYANVAFWLALMEHLPLADKSVDVVISNCVINLSPDKPSIFHEAFRVLKARGRLAITDIVAVRPLPSKLRDDLNVYCGCVGGAVSVKGNRRLLHEAGFRNVRVDVKNESAGLIASWFPGSGFEEYVRSATITAMKAQPYRAPHAAGQWNRQFASSQGESEDGPRDGQRGSGPQEASGQLAH